MRGRSLPIYVNTSKAGMVLNVMYFVRDENCCFRSLKYKIYNIYAP